METEPERLALDIKYAAERLAGLWKQNDRAVTEWHTAGLKREPGADERFYAALERRNAIRDSARIIGIEREFRAALSAPEVAPR